MIKSINKVLQSILAKIGLKWSKRIVWLLDIVLIIIIYNLTISVLSFCLIASLLLFIKLIHTINTLAEGMIIVSKRRVYFDENVKTKVIKNVNYKKPKAKA